LGTSVKLTDRIVGAAVGRTKEYKLADGAGLYLLVKPTGARLWRFGYRYGGKQKSLALGTYPDVSLARAWETCADARKLVRHGVDPSEQRKAQRRELSGRTLFRDIADGWLKIRRDLDDKTQARDARHVRVLKTGIGEKAIDEVTRLDLTTKVFDR
jgi:hypothetical protein